MAYGKGGKGDCLECGWGGEDFKSSKDSVPCDNDGFQLLVSTLNCNFMIFFKASFRSCNAMYAVTSTKPLLA